MQPTVSVIMATYNGAQYIEEQMQSLYAQTTPIDEVLFCDDGSSDATVTLVQSFIQKNNLQASWRVVCNPQNVGYANNFTGGLYQLKGDYLFFCDQDDIWLPNKVQAMVSQFAETPQIQLLCSDFEALISSADAPTIPQAVLDKMLGDGSLEQVLLNQKNLFIGSLGCVMAMRKTFCDAIQPYLFDGWAHDEFVWKLAQCFGGCYLYHEKLVQRRLHSNNVSMRKYHNLEKRIIFLQNLVKSHAATLQCARDAGCDANTLKMIEDNVVSAQLRVKMLAGKNPLYAILLLRYFKCYHSQKSILVEPLLAVKGLLGIE